MCWLTSAGQPSQVGGQDADTHPECGVALAEYLTFLLVEYIFWAESKQIYSLCYNWYCILHFQFYYNGIILVELKHGQCDFLFALLYLIVCDIRVLYIEVKLFNERERKAMTPGSMCANMQGLASTRKLNFLKKLKLHFNSMK